LRPVFACLVAAAIVVAVQPRIAVAQTYDTTMFRALQWRNVVPNRGGRTTTAAGVLGNPRIYYMGATGGGVWKTEDAGGTWRNISDGFFKTGSVGSIAVSDANPSVVYVGMGEAPVRGMMSSYGDGVYKSTDAGRTWTHVGLEKTRQIARVLIHPTDANIVYVAAQGSRWAPTDDRGVYRSSDGGATWKRILFVSPSAGASEIAMDPTNPRILYATFWDSQRTPWLIRSGGPGSGIWKSTDGGDTWTQLKAGLPPLMGRIGFAIAPATPSRVYALVEADSVFRARLIRIGSQRLLTTLKQQHDKTRGFPDLLLADWLVELSADIGIAEGNRVRFPRKIWRESTALRVPSGGFLSLFGSNGRNYPDS